MGDTEPVITLDRLEAKLDKLLYLLLEREEDYKANNNRWLEHVARGERLFGSAESKLDALAENQVKVCKALDAIAEAQGKLLAALNEHDAWAKETHAAHKKILVESDRLYEQRQAEWSDAAKGIAGLLMSMHERIDKLEPHPKPKRRKKR